MNNRFKLMSVLTAFIFAVSIYLVGCVNYDQKTTLKEDGSGSMKVHYWSSMKNFSMGTTLGKFEFDEAKAKDKYKSSNSDVTSIKVEDKLDDSTKHVYIMIHCVTGTGKRRLPAGLLRLSLLKQVQIRSQRLAGRC